ncbi:MAG: response regulator [Candidatus Marinimicrobia bacterium]|nr:response regulator [Candidatus Neomarinimicrobiota bacterium]
MKKLLIIDDDEDIRFIVKMILERSGRYTVLEAETASAGWASLTRGDINVLLLDYLLPDAKGLDLLQQLQDESLLQATQVVILTARKDPDLEQQFKKAGALAVLHKPFDPAHFFRTLETCLES